MVDLDLYFNREVLFKCIIFRNKVVWNDLYRQKLRILKIASLILVDVAGFFPYSLMQSNELKEIGFHLEIRIFIGDRRVHEQK